MSKIGRLLISMPAGVSCKLDKNELFVEGPKGKLSLTINSNISLDIESASIAVKRSSDLKAIKAMHGLFRVLINNMVVGVSKGYEKTLEVVGTGYKSAVSGDKLTLNVGFAHPVIFDVPKELNVKVDDAGKIIVSGISKHLVGQFASNIRRVRPPEPYKGKGIKYTGEIIKRKAGKSAKK